MQCGTASAWVSIPARAARVLPDISSAGLGPCHTAGLPGPFRLRFSALLVLWPGLPIGRDDCQHARRALLRALVPQAFSRMRPGRATPATKPSCALAREQADGLPRRDAHPWGWRGSVPLAVPLGAQAHGLPRRDAHPSGCRALRASCGATRGALSGPAAPGAPGAGPEWGVSGPRSRPGATGKHVDSGRIRPPGARTARPDPP